MIAPLLRCNLRVFTIQAPIKWVQPPELVTQTRSGFEKRGSVTLIVRLRFVMNRMYAHHCVTETSVDGRPSIGKKPLLPRECGFRATENSLIVGLTTEHRYQVAPDIKHHEDNGG